MQPNQNQPDQWQQPTAAQSAAPYQPIEDTESPTPTPVVETTTYSPAPTPVQAPAAPVDPVVEPISPTTPQPPSVEPISQPQPVAAQPISPEPIDQPAPTAAPLGVASAQPLDPIGSDENPGQPDSEALAPDDDEVRLQWQSPEYMHHDRTPRWYFAAIAVAVVLVLVAIFVFRSPTFAILIPVMMVALFVYIRSVPDVVQYTLSRKGLHLNDKLISYDTFKSFGVTTTGEVHALHLIPRKRFQMSQTVYFPTEIGEQLVDMMAARLPMKDYHPDFVDRLLAKLRI